MILISCIFSLPVYLWVRWLDILSTVWSSVFCVFRTYLCVGKGGSIVYGTMIHAICTVVLLMFFVFNYELFTRGLALIYSANFTSSWLLVVDFFHRNFQESLFIGKSFVIFKDGTINMIVCIILLIFIVSMNHLFAFSILYVLTILIVLQYSNIVSWVF